jgi:ketosteroid isomerase-like protein
MSQLNVEVVRMPLRVGERSSRTLEQRLALRFPRLAATYARLVIGRLSPTSRLRKAIVGRAGRFGLEAFNRRDLDAFLVAYHPDCEVNPPREFVEAGLSEASYHGPAGYRAWVSEWSEVWGADLRVEPLEVIDLGDQIVLLAEMPTRGRASGVALTGKYATIATLRDGRVIRDQVYVHHGQALEAVGLSE